MEIIRIASSIPQLPKIKFDTAGSMKVQNLCVYVPCLEFSSFTLKSIPGT